MSYNLFIFYNLELLHYYYHSFGSDIYLEIRFIEISVIRFYIEIRNEKSIRLNSIFRLYGSISYNNNSILTIQFTTITERSHAQS